MRSINVAGLLIALLASSFVPAGHAAEADRAAEMAARDQTAELEASIKEARARLDEAARKLAELHSRMWRLETTGPRAGRPMLGILLQDAGDENGLTLAGVTPEGGAERAGLQAGDTIVSINGVALNDGGDTKPLHALGKAMASVEAGDTVPVRYRRDGEIRSAEVVTVARGQYMARVVEEKGPWLDSLRSLGELEDLEALEGLEDLDVLEGLDEAVSDIIVRAPAGLRLEDVAGELAGYFGVDAGVLVMEAPDRQSALVPGDILRSLDGEAVTDARSALRRMAGLDGQVAAQVRRNGRDLDLALDAGALNERQALHVFRSDRRIRIQRDGEGDAVRLEIVVKKD